MARPSGDTASGRLKSSRKACSRSGTGWTPHQSEASSLGACREQQVFHSGGAVLHPVFAVIGRRGVPANEDGERSLLDHTRIWMEIRYLIQFLAVRDDHEPPRLDAPCGRRGHGGAQQFFDRDLLRQAGSGTANAAASRRTSKASIRTLLSLGLCSLHHTRTVFVAPEPICRAPSVKMPCSPHGCLDILFGASGLVTALSCVYSFRSGQRNEGFVPAVFVPRTYFVCWLFFFILFRDSVF